MQSEIFNKNEIEFKNRLDYITKNKEWSLSGRTYTASELY